MQRAAILARFCAKAGFFPQDEADNIQRQFASSPDASRLSFESWAVSKGFLSVVQARGVVEMFEKSRFLCLGCGRDLHGREFIVHGNNLQCPGCQGGEFRIQGAAGASTNKGPVNATGRAPRAPRAPRMDEVSHPDDFEDFESDEPAGSSEYTPTPYKPESVSGTEQWALDGMPSGFDDQAPPLDGHAHYGIGETISPAMPMPNHFADFSALPPPPPLSGHAPPPLPLGGFDAPTGFDPPPTMTPRSSGPNRQDNEITATQLDRGLPEGSILEGIKIIKIVGRGGNGIVYKGIQQKLDRVVALKILNGNVLQDDVQNSRFQLEARAAAQLEHPNIVQVYTFGDKFGRPFLVMQWIDGESLGQAIDSVGPMPISKVVDFAIQACQGLHEAHKHDIVHRDVKPDNLIINSSGLLKIVDFGLAKQTSSEIMLSDPRFVLGTPAYIAPEQALGQPIDARTDIYSLGITLYHALTGEIPFDGPAGAVVHKHIQTPLPSPRLKRPDIPRELDQLIQQMCAKVPNQRPRDMAEVAERLKKIQRVLETKDTGQNKSIAGDIVDQVFDGSGTQIYIPGDAPGSVAPPPAIPFDELDEIMGTGQRERASSAEFKPIEEIEFTNAPAMPDAVPMAAPPPPTKPAASAAPVTPTPSPSTATQTPVPSTPSPTATGGGQAGMKGRRAADNGAAPKAAPSAAAAADVPAESETALRDNDAGTAVQQILGKDYTAKLSAFVPEIEGKRRRRIGQGKPVFLLGFLALLVLVGLIGSAVYALSQDSAEVKHFKELCQRMMTTDLKNAQAVKDELVAWAEQHGFTDKDEYKNAMARAEDLIGAREQELFNDDQNERVAFMNLSKGKLRDLTLKLSRYNTPEAIDDVAVVQGLLTELDGAMGQTTAMQAALKDFRERNKRFPVSNSFENAEQSLANAKDMAAEAASSAQTAIQLRHEQDKQRESVMADAKRILGTAFDATPQNVSVPAGYDAAAVKILLGQLRNLFELTPRFKSDAELTRLTQIITELQRQRQELESRDDFIAELAEKSPEEQLKAIEFKALQDPELARSPEVQSVKTAAEARIVELREQAKQLIELTKTIQRPAQAIDARSIKTRVTEFLPSAFSADKPMLQAAETYLGQIITTDDNNRAELAALTSAVATAATVDEAKTLQTKIEAFATRVTYLDVADLKLAVADKIRDFVQHAERLAVVDGLLARVDAAKSRADAAALRAEIAAKLAEPGFDGFADYAAPVLRRLDHLVQWLTFAAPPTFDGQPWQIRSLVGAEGPLALGRVIGKYLPAGHAGPIKAVNFATIGADTLLVTAGARSVKIWHLGEVPDEWRSFGPFEADITDAKLIGDTRLGIAVGNEVRLYDIATRERLGAFTGHVGVVLDFAVSPDGVWLATAGADRKANIYRIDEPGNPKHSLRDFRDQVTAVTFSPGTLAGWNGKSERDRFLITGSRDRSVQMWYTSTDPFGTRFRNSMTAHDAAIRDVAATSDGDHIVVVDESGKGYVWLTFLQRQQKKFQAHPQAVTAALVTGGQLVTGSTDGTLKIFELSNAEPIGEPMVIGTAINAISASPDGRYFVAGTEAGLLAQWDIAANRAVNPPDVGHVLGLSHVSAGAKLAANQPGTFTVSRDGSAAIWNAESGQLVKFMRAEGSPVFVGGGLTADGTYGVAVAADGRVFKFNLRTGRPSIVESATTTVPQVVAAAMAADGTTLLLADATAARVVAFNVARGSVSATLRGTGGKLTSLAVSAEGNRVAAGTDDSMAFIWNLSTPASRPVQCGGMIGAVSALAFSADGKFLLAGCGTSTEGEAHLFDVARGGNAEEMYGTGGRSAISAVAFDPAGTRVVVATERGTLAVYSRQAAEQHDPLAQLDLTESGDAISTITTANNRLIAGTARGVTITFDWR